MDLHISVVGMLCLMDSLDSKCILVCSWEVSLSFQVDRYNHNDLHFALEDLCMDHKDLDCMGLLQ
jgi:hypothetical protein